MLPGADLRQALQAGLWEALAEDGTDRAAMRATCRDARDMADTLHDTAVLPVGPGTWYSAGAIAAYHCRLGAVRSLHVWFSGCAEDGARAVHFMEAYSTALGAPLPAADCSIAMPNGRNLPAALAAVLLQNVLPRVERLELALSSYDNVEQLLQALEPCARLCSLQLLPLHDDVEGTGAQDARICFQERPGALAALCRLPRLHTLSGPWVIEAPHLQRLCDALPSLTTLGFRWLNLHGAGTCISRRLHTLAAWCHSAGDESVQLDRPWHLQRGTCFVRAPHKLLTSLPALHLDALKLFTRGVYAEDLPAMQAVMQRSATSAERWTWAVGVDSKQELQVLGGLSLGSLAGLKHLDVSIYIGTWVQNPDLMPIDVASALSSLVSAAPNITTLAMCGTDTGFGGPCLQTLSAMMQPFRRAAHLHTLWLFGGVDADAGTVSAAAGQAALLEGVVRCMAQPGAEGGDEYCRALRHVLLAGAQPAALAACRAALARDGICVLVDTCDIRNIF